MPDLDLARWLWQEQCGVPFSHLIGTLFCVHCLRAKEGTKREIHVPNGTGHFSAASFLWGVGVIFCARDWCLERWTVWTLRTIRWWNGACLSGEGSLDEATKICTLHVGWGCFFKVCWKEEVWLVLCLERYFSSHPLSGRANITLNDDILCWSSTSFSQKSLSPWRFVGYF